MNLKESFRYQNYIRSMFSDAKSSILDQNHAFKVSKLHRRHDANPEAEDFVEELEDQQDFYPNDQVIAFISALIDEKERLCKAISRTKREIMDTIGISIDQVTECNKMRREAAETINRMLWNKSSKRIERGQAWKLNVEGNQSPYYYEIEVTKTEAFNRDAAKETVKGLYSFADEMSGYVDDGMVNYEVEFEPMFDVNDSFDDAMEKFLKSLQSTEQ